MTTTLRDRFVHGVERVSPQFRDRDIGGHPAVTDIAAFAVELEQQVVQSMLEDLGGLELALIKLHEHQQFKGFVQDALGLERIRVYSRDQARFLLAHFNPNRANRSSGAGRATPPRSLKGKQEPRCFLCDHDQKWQQRGLQLHYRHTLAGEPFRFCCNPFPFGSFHTTVASDAHLPQQWTDATDLQQMVAAMVEIAAQLRGWLVMYNGVGAGASISNHRHFHLLKPDAQQQPLPLQHAASLAARFAKGKGPLTIQNGCDYPLLAVRMEGPSDVLLEQAVRLAIEWHAVSPANATENVVVTWEGPNLCLYYIPRDSYTSAPGFSGAVASLEALGEFVFSAAPDFEAFKNGSNTYEKMAEMLAAVCPLKARSLVSG